MNILLLRQQLLGLFLLVAFCGPLTGQSFRKSYAPTSSFCRDLVETSDGGFFLVGGIANDSSLFLQRTDANGMSLWTKHQPLNGAQGIAVCNAPDGGFAVLCENYFDGTQRRNLLLRLDTSGNTLWQKVLDNPTLFNGFRDIVATASGGFALVGDARTFVPIADVHIQLLRLDASGNTLWNQSLGDLNAGKELALGLTELPNGDLAVAGQSREAATTVDGSDFFLARTDAQGNIIWQHTYPKPGYQNALDFKADASGNLYLLAETKQIDPAMASVLKVAGDGTELWFQQVLPLYNNLNLIPIRLISCFALDLAGSLYLPFQTISDFQTTEELALLKMSAAGDSVWIHESDLQDLPQAGSYTSDNMFAFAGKSGISTNFGQAVLIKGDWSGGFNSFYSTIYGQLFWDTNLNCTADTLEQAPPFFMVRAEDQSGDFLYDNLSANGYYAFTVSPGTYTITVWPAVGTEPLWVACDTPVVTISTTNQLAEVPAIGIQNTVDCPFLEINLSASAIRRCTTSKYYVNYCNYGTATATDVTIRLVLDPLCSYQNSAIPLAGQSGDTLFFAGNNLAPGDCATFWVSVLVDCAAENGQVLCSEAHIFPDSVCLPSNSQWDGSNVEVAASCNGDVQFSISNTGTGDMAGTVNYIIIEDQIMLMQGLLQLDSGADSVITIPNPQGSAYYIKAGQRPGHPAHSVPTAIADMCNGQPGSPLALQLSLGNADPFLDIYCAQVVSSFDPNDKRGFPLGWRDEHFLEAGQAVEYMIRFQNTGNDTAFLVVIRDTLPPQLNPATIRPGPASHPYQFQLDGSGALRFTFSQILLPDSTTNEPESHGFVSFKVEQRPDLPLGTKLENTAAIYFDFNDPVITNTYFHTIGHPLLTFTVDPPGSPESLDLAIFPNPATTSAQLQLIGQSAAGNKCRFSLYNANGTVLRQDWFSGASYQFERGDLPAGLYFFHLENTQGATASGKLMLK